MTSTDINELLDQARNMFGPLDAATRKRITRCYESPTIQNWAECFSIIVGADRFSTLWQCVIAVSPAFPRQGRSTDAHERIVKDWERAPTREELIDALIFATR